MLRVPSSVRRCLAWRQADSWWTCQYGKSSDRWIFSCRWWSVTKPSHDPPVRSSNRSARLGIVQPWQTYLSSWGRWCRLRPPHSWHSDSYNIIVDALIKSYGGLSIKLALWNSHSFVSSLSISMLSIWLHWWSWGLMLPFGWANHGVRPHVVQPILSIT